MEWEITIHPDKKYVEIVSTGFADKDSTMGMANSIKETMRNKRITKVLIDHSHLTGVSGIDLEVYARPKIFRLIGVILGIKIAEIINPAHLDHFRFLEKVCKNNGFSFSIFYNKTDALKWLLG